MDATFVRQIYYYGETYHSKATVSRRRRYFPILTKLHLKAQTVYISVMPLH